MPPLKNQRQERFCLEYFKSGNAAASAVKAGYSVKAVRQVSSRLLTFANIQKRLGELRKKAEAASIMTVVERKQRLSEIGRAKIPDFVGEDGITVSKDSPNAGAVAEVTTRTKLFRKTGEAINITNLKLHSPIQAINELNKMEGVYTDQVNINVNLIPALNSIIIQVVQLFNQVYQIPDKEQMRKAFLLGFDKQIESLFPELPKEKTEE